MARKQKDPLGPLETVVVALIALTAALLAIIGVGGALGGATSLDGVSTSAVCVTSTPGAIIPWGGRDPAEGGDQPFGLRDGVVWGTDTFHVCDQSPSASTVALGFSRAALRPIVSVGALLLLWRVIRRGRSQGLFSDAIPADLRRLALFILFGAAVQLFWSARVNALLLGRMADDAHGTFLFPQELPFGSVLIALGLITLARVMAHAVALREDVEATV